LHGWRAFAGEVGIIVVGVLIALGAEQMVESIHLRWQTRQAQEALRAEIHRSYAGAYELHAVHACLGKQLDSNVAGVVGS
jgi:type II secretory pathway pseudopilin PulG